MNRVMTNLRQDKSRRHFLGCLIWPAGDLDVESTTDVSRTVNHNHLVSQRYCADYLKRGNTQEHKEAYKIQASDLRTYRLFSRKTLCCCRRRLSLLICSKTPQSCQLE